MRAFRFAAVAMVMAIAVAGLVLLLAAGAPAPWLKSRLSRMVLENTQRTLVIDGDLSWTLSMTPAIEIRLGHATLSERSNAQVFATIDGARVSLRLGPLLSRQIVIDGIELTGPRVTVVRHADGTLNIDDLLAPRKPGERPLRFDVAAARISGGEFLWLDEAASHRATLSGIRLETGRLARTATGALEFSAQLRSPPVDTADLRLTARYDFDFDAPAPRFAVERLEAKFSATAGALRLDGRMETPVVFNPAARTLRLADFAGTLAVVGTQPSLPPISLTGSLDGDFTRQTAQGRLAATFDDSHVIATFDAPKLAPLSLVADIDIDRFDADRFLPASSRQPDATVREPSLPSLPSIPGFLRGQLRIGSLRVAGATMRNLHFAIGDAANGNLGNFGNLGGFGTLRIPGQAGQTQPSGKNGTRKERHAAHAPA